MAFWWVNHKQTKDHEVRGGYLWSPIRNKDNGFNQSYENMTLVRPGDIVFSYANAHIGAIGRVTEAAFRSPKPHEFGKVGDYWSNEGWLVNVYFSATPKPLHPKQHIDAIAPLLPTRHSPIQANGNGNQGIYLASISDALGLMLLALIGIDASPDFDVKNFVRNSEPDIELLDDLNELEQQGDVSETQRLQLAKARVGQGFFRKQVMLLGPSCRVTGVEDSRLLIASHIKPWRDSSNEERISGYNGIMLSPHVDALFDEALISFENDGTMLTHPSLPNDVLHRWSIKKGLKVEPFMDAHSRFLEHHRKLFLTRSA